MLARHSSHFILGGARSGKSRHALEIARSLPARVGFVATAQALDADIAARIARHRAERPAGWPTVEEPFDLVGACRRMAASVDCIVVDCLTLWTANLALRGGDDRSILAATDELAAFMRGRLASIIIISNEVGEGVHPATTEGLRFRDLLGLVNQRVAAAADRVTLMVAGIPLEVKPPAPPARASTTEAGDDIPPQAP